jgi:hypothetical protein
LQKGDFTTFGKDEDIVKTDTSQLQTLLQQSAAASPTASPKATPTASP